MFSDSQLSRNLNISTRPEGQPMATVDADIAEADDRYSEGNHNKFSEPRIIHMLLEFKP